MLTNYRNLYIIAIISGFSNSIKIKNISYKSSALHELNVIIFISPCLSHYKNICELRYIMQVLLNIRLFYEFGGKDHTFVFSGRNILIYMQ
jgi:hypothetical protein